MEKDRGHPAAARRLFELGQLFSCAPESGNKVFNSIIKKTANDNAVKLIDFYEIVMEDFGRSPLFVDGRLPQENTLKTIKNNLKGNR